MFGRRTFWCWRCQLEMPMLDEVEFAEINRLYAESFRAKGDIDARFAPVREAYERMTGFANVNHNAVLHHRLALLGPPCVACGKPLRTPKAKHCAACGTTSRAG